MYLDHHRDLEFPCEPTNIMTEVRCARPGVADAERTETKEQLSPSWNVIVHNDPINMMSYVTMVFQRVFGYPQHKAHRLMLEVHHSGRSLVWTGEREQAELYVHQLHGYQLLAILERVEF